MQKLFLGVCAAALVSSAADAQQHFTFTDQLDTYYSGSGQISGSFDGSLNGNLITNISNVIIAYDGETLSGSGSFYVEHYDDNCSGGFCAGGAIASLDGTQNNFMFINSDYANGDHSYNQFYFSIAADDTGNELFNTDGTYFYGGGAGHFAARLAPVPEPASWALMVGGFGLVGGFMRARRKAGVRFA